MGLLDDAIREHLDLKRRRGADPAEIAREEAEALGPVRRDAAAAEPAEVAYPDDAAGIEDPGEAYAEPEHQPAPHDDPHDDPRDHPHLDEAPTTHEAPYAEPEAESATPPHGDPYQATREFSAEELEAALRESREAERPEEPGAVSSQSAEAAAAAEAAEAADAAGTPEGEGEGEGEGDHDELEETPEFLQETPEHDRLWFEQKPPKDFDF